MTKKECIEYKKQLLGKSLDQLIDDTNQEIEQDKRLAGMSLALNLNYIINNYEDLLPGIEEVLNDYARKQKFNTNDIEK